MDCVVANMLSTYRERATVYTVDRERAVDGALAINRIHGGPLPICGEHVRDDAIQPI